MQNSTSFDAAAATYDDEFTFSEIGKRQRARVFHWLRKSKVLKTSKSVFEVNCGTGYDAQRFHELGLKVVATDVSSEMIKLSKVKRNKKIQFYNLDFIDISDDVHVGKSDLVFSNFGGLNCLSEKSLRLFINDLARKQKRGDNLAFVIMAKYCLSEDFYLLLAGKAGEMGRRNRHKYLEVNVNGEKVKTYYHSPATVKNLLVNDYHVKLIKPVAAFLPPSYLEPFFKKRIGLLSILYFLERTFGRLSFLAAKSDHYIIVAERK